MPTSPFPIATPRHLLKKAKREIERLKSEANGDYSDPSPTVVADLTINAAWTLWHVTDWIGRGALQVVADVVPRQMKKPAKKRTDAFQRRLRARSQDLRICWGLALRFKHFELEADSHASGMFDDEAVVTSSAIWGAIGDGRADVAEAARVMEAALTRIQRDAAVRDARDGLLSDSRAEHAYAAP
jgi:hypothetical protein